MSDALKAEYLEALEARLHKARYNRISVIFPDKGPFRRELYPKHMALIAAMKEKPYCCMMAGNGVGKSDLGAAMTTWHATGLYPDWWDEVGGWRPGRPIQSTLAGNSWKDTRDSIQAKLLGPENDEGTGMIPAHLIVDKGAKVSNTGCVDWIEVQHVSGRTSMLYLKAYEQGAESFRMTNRDWIWLDEEPPLQVYAECVQRFRGESADGRLYLSFTPDKGISEVVQMFCWNLHQSMTEDEFNRSGRFVINVSQDEVPHQTLDEIERKALNTEPHLKEARRHGTPGVGTGNVYQVEESLFVVPPFQIPRSWPRVWSMDPGYNDACAVLWGAHDRHNGVWYIWDEFYESKKMMADIAFAVRQRGQWIPGVVDTNANSTNSQVGEKSLAKEYRSNGLRVIAAEKGNIEDTVRVVHEHLHDGRLKVFSTCKNLLREYRMYRRDPKGKIIDKYNHAMDALRYLITGGGIDNAMEAPFGKTGTRYVPEETFGIH